MKKSKRQGIVKESALRDRWWWLKRRQGPPSALRRSTILYEFAARLDATDVMKLKYWYGKPWNELEMQHRMSLEKLWPAKIENVYFQLAENEGIEEALKEPRKKPWSPWWLLSFNLQHDNNALIQALRSELDQARCEIGMSRHQPTMGMPKIALSFACVEILDRKLAGLALTESQAATLRRKLAEYRPEIEEGRKQFKSMPPAGK